jgi:hypothetical protein
MRSSWAAGVRPPVPNFPLSDRPTGSFHDCWVAHDAQDILNDVTSRPSLPMIAVEVEALEQLLPGSKGPPI